MMDLFELRHLFLTIQSTEELDLKMIELVKTMFGRHTLLSILQYNEEYLSKIMVVVNAKQEEIINLAGQASEAEVNSELVRILYRILGMPTPVF